MSSRASWGQFLRSAAAGTEPDHTLIFHSLLPLAFLPLLFYPPAWILLVIQLGAALLLLITAWRNFLRGRVLRRPRNLRLKYGEWALITGASAGLGREFAEELASRGMSVVLVARRAEVLTELARDLESRFAVHTRIVAADLSVPGSERGVVDAVADLEISLLVNNAGVGYVGHFKEQDLERLSHLVHLNCMAVMTLTRLLLPPMLQRRRGGIIIVSSVAGYQPIPLHAVYAASKAFDSVFGVSLWDELKGTGVDVVVSEPASLRTQFGISSGTSDGRGASPRLVAQATVDHLGVSPYISPGSTLAWLRSCLAAMLPRYLITPLARKRQERLLPR